MPKGSLENGGQEHLGHPLSPACAHTIRSSSGGTMTRKQVLAHGSGTVVGTGVTLPPSHSSCPAHSLGGDLGYYTEDEAGS